MSNIYVYDTRAFTDAKSAGAANKLVLVGQFDIGSESYLLDLLDAITATEECLGVSQGVCRPYLDCPHKYMSESFLESYGDGSVCEFKAEPENTYSAYVYGGTGRRVYVNRGEII